MPLRVCPAAKRAVIGAALVTLAAGRAAPAGAQQVRNTSYPAADGSRVLQHAVEVPAPIADVWAAWTTTDGVRSWAVPVASVDFRIGGVWESSYDPAARIGAPGNIRNRFLGYVPGRMLAFQAVQAPPNFPHRELLSELFTVVELEPLGERRTRVVVSMVGYRAGEGFDVLYRHFDRGNAWTLGKLHERFVKGPTDWRAVFAGEGERPDAEKPGVVAPKDKRPRR